MNKILPILLSAMLTGCATLEDAAHERDLCVVEGKKSTDQCELEYRQRVVEIDGQRRAGQVAAGVLAVGVIVGLGAAINNSGDRYYYSPPCYSCRSYRYRR